jgi:diguanylate cyclase (GGDEF)-like protein/PAS domain S-box-containing protein
MDAQEALDLLEQEHQALLQFVYLSPVGLVHTRSDGEIVMVNPVAAQLLMPLSRDGLLDNLFTTLQEVAPDLQDRLDTSTSAHGLVCDGLQLPVQVSQGPRSEARLLSFSLLRINADRCMALLQDVTAQVHREHRLRQQEAWLGAILAGVTDYALVTLDHAGRIIEWNDSIQRISGFSPEAVHGQTLALFYPSDGITPERVVDHLREADHSGCSLDEGWRVRADGTRYWGSVLITPLRLAGSESAAPDTAEAPRAAHAAYCLILRDLSEHRDTAAQARQAAVCDYLTGIHNRRAFFEAAERETRRLKQRPRPLSVVVFDVDHFKRINDSLGHPVGDAVLCHIAGTMRATFREVDVVARIGGEEFAVLLPSTDLEGAHTVAERFCRRLAASPASTAAGEVPCTVSAGIATMDDCGGDLNVLMQRADQALYAAKAAGRNRVCGLAPGAAPGQPSGSLASP